MRINLYNYDILAKRMSQNYYLLMQFIEENSHLDFEQLKNLINQKFNYDGPQNGYFTFNTKTIALLNITKQELKSLFQKDDRHNYIYNKDFQIIIQRIREHNKNNHNQELYELEIFFKFSIKAKSDFIALYSQSKEL